MSWLLLRSSSLRKERLPKAGEMRPDRSKEFRRSATIRSRCRWPQITPGQLQRWLDLFHEASKLDGLEDTMDLKDRSACSSVKLLFSSSMRACEHMHSSKKWRSFIALAMRKSGYTRWLGFLFPRCRQDLILFTQDGVNEA